MIVNHQAHTSPPRSLWQLKPTIIKNWSAFCVLRHRPLYYFSYVLMFYLPPCQQEINQLCCQSNTPLQKYSAILLACRLPLCWANKSELTIIKSCCFIISWQSKAWLGVIIFPDAMHTRRSNQAITMLHCNVSIMLLIEITSQPPTPPQHTHQPC